MYEAGFYLDTEPPLAEAETIEELLEKLKAKSSEIAMELDNGEGLSIEKR